MYFGAFNPNGVFTANPGVEFVDVTTWKLYRQDRVPAGNVWKFVAELKTELLSSSEIVTLITNEGFLQTVAVDGVTITGDGSPGNALVATGAASAYTVIPIVFADSPYTVLPIVNTHIYRVDCSGGNIVLLFPSAVGNVAMYGVKKVDATLNTITLTPNGAETIDGQATQVIKFRNTEVDIFSDNVNLKLK